jgi:hypothetical protein
MGDDCRTVNAKAIQENPQPGGLGKRIFMPSRKCLAIAVSRPIRRDPSNARHHRKRAENFLPKTTIAMEQDNRRAFARAHEVNRQTPYRNMRSQQWGTFPGVQVVFPSFRIASIPHAIAPVVSADPSEDRTAQLAQQPRVPSNSSLRKVPAPSGDIPDMAEPEGTFVGSEGRNAAPRQARRELTTAFR